MRRTLAKIGIQERLNSLLGTDDNTGKSGILNDWSIQASMNENTRRMARAINNNENSIGHVSRGLKISGDRDSSGIDFIRISAGVGLTNSGDIISSRYAVKKPISGYRVGDILHVYLERIDTVVSNDEGHESSILNGDAINIIYDDILSGYNGDTDYESTKEISKCIHLVKQKKNIAISDDFICLGHFKVSDSGAIDIFNTADIFITSELYTDYIYNNNTITTKDMESSGIYNANIINAETINVESLMYTSVGGRSARYHELFVVADPDDEDTYPGIAEINILKAGTIDGFKEYDDDGNPVTPTLPINVLRSIDVTGNVTATGNVAATGNVTAGNVTTTGSVAAGSVIATGTIIAASLVAKGDTYINKTMLMGSNNGDKYRNVLKSTRVGDVTKVDCTVDSIQLGTSAKFESSDAAKLHTVISGGNADDLHTHYRSVPIGTVVMNMTIPDSITADDALPGYVFLGGDVIYSYRLEIDHGAYDNTTGWQYGSSSAPEKIAWLREGPDANGEYNILNTAYKVKGFSTYNNSSSYSSNDKFYDLFKMMNPDMMIDIEINDDVVLEGEVDTEIFRHSFEIPDLRNAFLSGYDNTENANEDDDDEIFKYNPATLLEHNHGSYDYYAGNYDASSQLAGLKPDQRAVYKTTEAKSLVSNYNSYYGEGLNPSPNYHRNGVEELPIVMDVGTTGCEASTGSGGPIKMFRYKGGTTESRGVASTEAPTRGGGSPDSYSIAYYMKY